MDDGILAGQRSVRVHKKRTCLGFHKRGGQGKVFLIVVALHDRVIHVRILDFDPANHVAVECTVFRIRQLLFIFDVFVARDGGSINGGCRPRCCRGFRGGGGIRRDGRRGICRGGRRSGPAAQRPRGGGRGGGEWHLDVNRGRVSGFAGSTGRKRGGEQNNARQSEQAVGAFRHKQHSLPN